MHRISQRIVAIARAEVGMNNTIVRQPVLPGQPLIHSLRVHTALFAPNAHVPFGTTHGLLDLMD